MRDQDRQQIISNLKEVVLQAQPTRIRILQGLVLQEMKPKQTKTARMEPAVLMKVREVQVQEPVPTMLLLRDLKTIPMLRINVLKTIRMQMVVQTKIIQTIRVPIAILQAETHALMKMNIIPMVKIQEAENPVITTM
jgi:hypothetical protein